MEKNYKTKKEEMKNEKTAGNAVVFENPEFGKILTQTDENGEPLFCAKDVCDVLGLSLIHISRREEHSSRTERTG